MQLHLNEPREIRGVMFSSELPQSIALPGRSEEHFDVCSFAVVNRAVLNVSTFLFVWPLGPSCFEIISDVVAIYGLLLSPQIYKGQEIRFLYFSKENMIGLCETCWHDAGVLPMVARALLCGS